MDKKTETSLREFWESQGINESQIDWLIGFSRVLEQKAVGLFAQEAGKLLEVAAKNGSKDNQNPEWFDFALKVKGYCDNLSVVKVDYSLTYSESHKRKDGVMVEVKGGRLMEQTAMFDHRGDPVDPDDEPPELDE